MYFFVNVYSSHSYYIFVTEVYTDHDKVDLLPPSAFETHTVDAAWKELARATNEVMQLKLENQKLRFKYILHVKLENHAKIKCPWIVLNKEMLKCWWN